MSDGDIPVEETVVALQNKRDVQLTMPWFVEKAKYPPRGSTVIHPLINGERAFAAVHDAIQAARQTIDIICWGFDPSMRLTRPSGPRIGDMLRAKARAGVAVRVLSWRNTVADLFENNLPGGGFLGSGGGAAGLGSGIGSTGANDASGKGGDFNNYGSGRGSAGVQAGDPQAKAYNREWYSSPGEGISFRTRDFSAGDRSDLKDGHIERHGNLTAIKQRLAFSLFASHHQKTLLVDYETPERATGFVMGHNFLRNYWDTDAHEYHSEARLFFGPWQDLSTRVYGPVLHDLNENFCTAWQKAQPMWPFSDQPIPASRSAIKPEAFAEPARKRGGSDMAQITRTHPQEGDHSIRESYKLALANARHHIYFENQYFRHADIAMHMRQARRKLKAAGWNRDLFVFVVTNKPDDHGRLTTHEMLRALGKGGSMPHIEKKQGGGDSGAERTLRKTDLQGLNVVVCTLCSEGMQYHQPQAHYSGGANAMGFPQVSISAPPPTRVYADIYVHSKLLLVDDVFFTLGSANVNERSLENDTEINIAAPSPAIAAQWRQRLWAMHTKRKPLADIVDEYRAWTDIAEAGLDARAKGNSLPTPLVEFFDDSTTGSRSD